MGSSSQDATDKTQNAPDETTLDAATATPVSEFSVQTEQAAIPTRNEASQGDHTNIPLDISRCSICASYGRQQNSSNDYSSNHHGDTETPRVQSHATIATNQNPISGRVEFMKYRVFRVKEIHLE
jgi:hypothetical protein